MRLPSVVYASDVEHMPVDVVDHLHPSLRERINPASLVERLGRRSQSPAIPPPVRALLMLTSSRDRATASLTLSGASVGVSSASTLRDDQWLGRCAPSPLRHASADETIELSLRWFLGIDRLLGWRLASEIVHLNGVEAIAVVASRFDDLEDFASREDCEGVSIVRGSRALLEREFAPVGVEAPRIAAIPCRGGLPGPMLAAIWPRGARKLRTSLFDPAPASRRF